MLETLILMIKGCLYIFIILFLITLCLVTLNCIIDIIKNNANKSKKEAEEKEHTEKIRQAQLDGVKDIMEKLNEMYTNAAQNYINESKRRKQK